MHRPTPALVAAFAAAALLALLPLATTASAGTTPPAPQPKIVGGDQASPGQFPFVAALIQNGQGGRSNGFRCGATVLSHTWALTAAHCVLDYDDQYPDSRYGNYVGPDFYSVLTGTNSILDDGSGQLLPVARIYAHPNYDPYQNTNDFALLRLANPTSAPPITIIGNSFAESALVAPGTNQTTVGWGVENYGDSSVPAYQRFVQVPVQDNTTCSNAYPADGSKQGLVFDPWTMICAGPLGGGQDSCSGDSGGPLAIQAPDNSWRQTGVVSFGLGCAEAGSPGVYSRLTAGSAWINEARRYGPFDADGIAFITQQYLDFTGVRPTVPSLVHWLSVMNSNPPATLINAFESGAKWDSLGGMVTRLYSAAYLRNPDTGGLSSWITSAEHGYTPEQIANNFAGSPEFVQRYGSLTDGQFIDLIYQNVFTRAPDSGGKSYWLGRLAAGASRGVMLYGLSNSSEYRTKTATRVRIITTEFALLRVAPSSGQITADQAISERTLIDNLRTSYRYAQRF